jgi:hypothetical protein
VGGVAEKDGAAVVPGRTVHPDHLVDEQVAEALDRVDDRCGGRDGGNRRRIRCGGRRSLRQ